MTTSHDWSEWMRALGRQVRCVREFVGMSQDRLARAAGVSQGAVSRIEAGKQLGTPLLVAVKVQTALVAALRTVDAATLGDELHAIAEATHAVSFPVNFASPAVLLTKDRRLDECGPREDGTREGRFPRLILDAGVSIWT